MIRQISRSRSFCGRTVAMLQLVAKFSEPNIIIWGLVEAGGVQSILVQNLQWATKSMWKSRENSMIAYNENEEITTLKCMKDRFQ